MPSGYTIALKGLACLHQFSSLGYRTGEIIGLNIVSPARQCYNFPGKAYLCRTEVGAMLLLPYMARVARQAFHLTRGPREACGRAAISFESIYLTYAPC